MPAVQHFTKELFSFLRDLEANNRRDWFEKNKARYREHVQGPALRFVADFAPALKKISASFRADPRPVGGSLFRIHRDTRFSKDKSPYKTSVGIQFRHDSAKDAHAPGFYLHLEPKSVFVAVGIWKPDGPTLRKIRDHVIEEPAAWKRAAKGKRFGSRFELAGDSLVRAPAGIDPGHALIEDLRRKDYIGVCELTPATATRPGFLKEFTEICRAGTPLVRYLCAALDIAF